MPRLSLLLAVLLVLFACKAELELPEGALLTCSADADCPGDLVCNPASGLCGSRDDTESPGLAAEPSLSDDRLTLAETLRLGFEVTEALALDPEVEIDLGGRFVPLVLDESATDRAALRYAFTYTPDGTETEGRTANVTIDLTDEAGNAARGLSGGAVVFDRTDPAVAFASVGYTPSDQNPIGVVELATEGTEVTVILVAAELLETAVVPALRARLGEEEVPLELVPGTASATGARFQGVVPEGLDDGDYALTVTWADLAGNLAEVQVDDPPIRVKISQPVLAIDQEQVTFVRSPWGSTARHAFGGVEVEPGPYFALAPGDPYSAEVELPLSAFSIGEEAPPNRLRVWVDAGKTTTLGEVFPTETGWPRKQLASFDTPRIFVTAIDDAGNESEPQLVEHVEWVATLAPPAVGENPNRLLSIPFAHEAEPVTDAELDVSGRIEVHGADGQSLHEAAALAWRRLKGGAPVPRLGPAMAFDSRRGKVVLFGGQTDYLGKSLADTWEWDGSVWTDVSPATGNPPPRSEARMVYDGERGRVVLFGGDSNGTLLGDTWEWDGSGWHEVPHVADASPEGRTAHAMVFDPVRGVIVLYGGFGAEGELADTWEYSAGHWIDLSPPASPEGPQAKMDHALGFDAASGLVVMAGGWSYSFDNRSATYLWDGTSWSRAPEDTAPPSAGGEMAIDPVTRQVVMFGGMDFLTSVPLDSVWRWDGTRWTEINPAPGPRPPVRSAFGAAYDHHRGRLVAFGGRLEEYPYEPLGDLWEWDGMAWQLGMPCMESTPTARKQHALAIDPVTEAPLMFGGRVEASGRGCRVNDEPETLLVYPSYCLLGSTWAWQGGTWLRLEPATAPEARSQHAMARFGDRVVLFGGFDAINLLDGSDYNAETWEWDGATWTERVPAHAPWPRAGHAMAWDRARDRLVLFGGYTFVDGQTITECPPGSARGNGMPSIPLMCHFHDTWSWDGTDWTEIPSSGELPAYREGAALGYDASGQQVLLFGGEGFATTFDPPGLLDDTWRLDANGWTRLEPSVRPAARRDPSLAYHEVREGLLLFGGINANTAKTDIWEWTGTEWNEITPEGLAPSSRDADVVYSPALGEVVLAAGDAPVGVEDDTWVLGVGGVDARPGFLFVADLVRANIDPTQIDSLRASALAGGAGGSGDAADQGASLHFWEYDGYGQWALGDENLAGPDLSGEPRLLWSAEGEALQSFVAAGPQRFEVLLRSRRPNDNLGGRQVAEIALDWIEVSVGYRATP